MNTFGKNIRLTTFGESHGPAIGGVLDGFPSGVQLDLGKIHAEMARRRPGNGRIISQRKEPDIPEFISGITSEGITLGTPIGFIIRNTDCRNGDYENLKGIYRPGHADFTTMARYGIRDHRGGGRASARETAIRVCAGAICRQWLDKKGIRVEAVLQQAGSVVDSKLIDILESTPSISVLPQSEKYGDMVEEIKQARNAGNSIGGAVVCAIFNLWAGIGNPVYDKLSSRLAEAMMSINAAKGFEIGSGFASAGMKGSDYNDPFIPGDSGGILTSSNRCGGLQGGISNGMPIWMRIAFHPTPTLQLEQTTVDSSGTPCSLKAAGRHDPCVALRAVPVVEAMALLTIVDFLVSK